MQANERGSDKAAVPSCSFTFDHDYALGPQLDRVQEPVMADPTTNPSMDFAQVLAGTLKELKDSICDGFKDLKRNMNQDYEEYPEDDYYSEHGDDDVPCVEPQSKRPRTGDFLSQLCAKNSVGENPESEVLRDIHDTLLEREKTAPPVNTLLAGIVDELMFKDSRPDDSKVKEKMEGVLRPVNCASLVNTRVDELIWSLMKPGTQSMDKKLQKTQTLIVKTVCLLTTVVDKLHTLKDKVQSEAQSQVVDIMKDGVAAIEMASYANYDLNLRRRDHIKPDIHGNYMSLFSTSIPINDNLFGGDAAKKLDDIEKINKAAAKARPSQSGYARDYQQGRNFSARGRNRTRFHRSRGFNRPSGSRGGHGSFLGGQPNQSHTHHAHQPHHRKKGH